MTPRGSDKAGSKGRSEATRGIGSKGRSEATRGIGSKGRSEATRGIDRDMTPAGAAGSIET
jgi:hypothetical protein